MATSLSARTPAALTIGAFLLHGVTLLLFHFRWDKLAMATVFPVWLYALVAFAMLGVALFIKRSLLTWLVAGIWLVTLPFIADETHGLIRAATGAQRPQPTAKSNQDQSLRIISLNCKARGLAAAHQVTDWHPDIVFLQEAPYHKQLQQLGESWFGDDAVTLRSRECAIIARGKRLRTVPLTGSRAQSSPRGVVAQLELLDGRIIELVNIHLDHATTKLSVWSRATWQQHAANRRSRRESLWFIINHRALIPNVTNGQSNRGSPLPSIVAGDFNAPAGDASTSPLHDEYTDAYRVAGIGWPNTFPADLPVHRIDQIWTNAKVTPQSLSAVELSGTDHRMVVCDFLINED